MKFLVTGSLALWGAMLVSGCGGGAGPPTPFNPFGTDPSGSVPEPAGSSGETTPAGGPGSQTIGQLCATVCAHIEASCPSYLPGSCASQCNQAATEFPSCVGELELFLSCAATGQITCNGQTVQAPSCMPAQTSLEGCEGGGTATTSTGGAP
jgi:hypothetical protein